MIGPLLRERIGPVRHPDYVACAGISSVASLSKARILAYSNEAQRLARRDATDELQGSGLEGLKAHERYEHFYLVIEDAAAQLGVALTPKYLGLRQISTTGVSAFAVLEQPDDLFIGKPRLPYRRSNLEITITSGPPGHDLSSGTNSQS